MPAVPEAQGREKCGWNGMNMGKVLSEEVRKVTEDGRKQHFMIQRSFQGCDFTVQKQGVFGIYEKVTGCCVVKLRKMEGS